MTELDRAEWIALTREPPLDDRRRIVDAAHHLYRDPRPNRAAYRLDDLLADTRAGHNVTDGVFVECHSGYHAAGPEILRPVGETEFVAGEARRSLGTPTRIAAIVAFADCSLGDGIDAVLDAHETAGNGIFRGIRHATARDASPEVSGDLTLPRAGLMSERSFRRGVARLGERGLSFDAWAYHTQLPELADLARAVGGTTVVVNHLGGPLAIGPYRDRDSVRSDWHKGMRLLAACPNVVVKLGGVGQDRIFATGWSSRPAPPGSDEVAKWWGDDLRWCIETFGPSRSMFESNYPVDRKSLGYTVLWNAFQKAASIYGDDEQNELFAMTAARTYRINLDSTPSS